MHLQLINAPSFWSPRIRQRRLEILLAGYVCRHDVGLLELRHYVRRVVGVVYFVVCRGREKSVQRRQFNVTRTVRVIPVPLPFSLRCNVSAHSIDNQESPVLCDQVADRAIHIVRAANLHSECDWIVGQDAAHFFDRARKLHPGGVHRVHGHGVAAPCVRADGEAWSLLQLGLITCGIDGFTVALELQQGHEKSLAC